MSEDIETVEGLKARISELEGELSRYRSEINILLFDLKKQKTLTETYHNYWMESLRGYQSLDEKLSALSVLIEQSKSEKKHGDSNE